MTILSRLRPGGIRDTGFVKFWLAGGKCTSPLQPLYDYIKAYWSWCSQTERGKETSLDTSEMLPVDIWIMAQVLQLSNMDVMGYKVRRADIVSSVNL